MMRGIDSRHELDPTLLLRDTRTVGQRLADFFADPTNLAIILFTLAAMSYYFSEAATLLMLIGGASFLYCFTRKQKLPFRLPLIARVKDYNDLKPGINKPNIARGIAFFGNDRKSGEELWFANDDMRTHAFESDDRPAGCHLAAIDGGDTQRFVVGLEGPNSLGFQQIADFA